MRISSKDTESEASEAHRHGTDTARVCSRTANRDLSKQLNQNIAYVNYTRDVLFGNLDKDFLTVETSYCIDTTFRPEGAKYTFPPKDRFLREYFSCNTVGANSQDTIGTDQSLYPDLYILYEEEAPVK